MRTLREAVDCDVDLFASWKWSEWYPLMAPETSEDRNGHWKKRHKKPGKRIRGKIVRQMFPEKDFSNTVYEIMMVRDTLNVTVYFGSTSREVSTRFGEYCSNGSHLAELIDDALSEGYWLYFRAKRNEGHSLDDYKDCALEEFDFAWNNKNKRRIITRNYTGRSRIKREKVHDNSLMNTRDWTDWSRIMKPGWPGKNDKKWAVRETTGQKRNLSQALLKHQGVFELKVKKDDHKITVYADSTDKEISKYCNGESAIEGLITDALLGGYSVYVRGWSACTTEIAETVADALLENYDYAWDEVRNGVRNILE